MRSVVTWTRETPWRQGHVLPQEAVEALGFAHTNLPEATCVIVISHDCDIANDDLSAEPDVEVIIGCLPTTTNGNFSWEKTPRTLHWVSPNFTDTLLSLDSVFQTLPG